MSKIINSFVNWLNNYKIRNPIEYDNTLDYKVETYHRAYKPEMTQIIVYYNDIKTASFFSIEDEGWMIDILRVNFNYSVIATISKYEINNWNPIYKEPSKTIQLGQHHLDRLIHELSPFKKIGLIDFKTKNYEISEIKFNLNERLD